MVSQSPKVNSIPGLPFKFGYLLSSSLMECERKQFMNAFIWHHCSHPTISFSVVPFSSCPQSFPASGSFQMSAPLLIRWPKCWSFSFNISPSNEHPGLVSFRMDWLDLLEVQGTLKNLLQPTVQKHQFFSAQLSL